MNEDKENEVNNVESEVNQAKEECQLQELLQVLLV